MSDRIVRRRHYSAEEFMQALNYGLGWDLDGIEVASYAESSGVLVTRKKMITVTLSQEYT